MTANQTQHHLKYLTLTFQRQNVHIKHLFVETFLDSQTKIVV